MKFMTMLVAVGILTSAAFAEDVKLTAANSTIEWTGTKKGGKHDGGFKKLTGTAALGKDPADLKLEVEIDCGSLYSDNEKLTSHLKSPDFFAVKDHPTSKFVIRSVAKEKKGFVVVGELTLLGKTKEIRFPAEISTSGKLTLKADFKINRTDFGMNYGKGMVDDEVAIRLKVDSKAGKK